MNPRNYRPCRTCGITTQAQSGTCRDCQVAETDGPRPCLWCGAATKSDDRHCHSCAAYIRAAQRHVDKPCESLPAGDWVFDPRARILRWEAA